MRGRTIYFQNRRILVFCGQKRIQPHSINDRFGAANEGTLIGDNAEIKNTDSVLTEAENGAAVGDTDEPLITTTNARPLADEKIALGENTDGISNVSRFSAVESGVSIDQHVGGKAHILRLGKVKTDISIGENAETLKTEKPLFTEAVEDITTGENADMFKTSVIKRDCAAAGIFIGDNITSKKYTFLLGSAKSGAAILQNVAGYVETPVATGDFVSFSSETPFTLKMYNSTSYLWDGAMEYSTDSINWSAWDGTLIGGTNRLYLRGSNNTKAKGLVNWMIFDGNGVSIGGNIETLFDYNTVRLGGHPTLAEYGLYMLFQNNPAIVNIRDLIIGFDIIPRYGCQAMFNNCSNLETSPIFRSTNLYDLAYYQMFRNCPKLKTISQMPETAAERDRCYAEMYKGCAEIKISETQTDEYVNAWKMPQMIANRANDMFAGTGGTFTGTPSSNTTYYTANEIIS